MSDTAWIGDAARKIYERLLLLPLQGGPIEECTHEDQLAVAEIIRAECPTKDKPFESPAPPPTDDLIKVLHNSGVDTTCGACMEVAFTGVTTNAHTCKPKEPPLLQCVDCRNTESPAGAMARAWNHGRCMHCGGHFKVVRA